METAHSASDVTDAAIWSTLMTMVGYDVTGTTPYLPGSLPGDDYQPERTAVYCLREEARQEASSHRGVPAVRHTPEPRDETPRFMIGWTHPSDPGMYYEQAFEADSLEEAKSFVNQAEEHGYVMGGTPMSKIEGAWRMALIAIERELF